MCDIYIPVAIEFTTTDLAKKKEFTDRAAAHHIVADYDDQNRNLTATLFYLFASQSLRRVY
jgi:hypothetical protein